MSCLKNVEYYKIKDEEFYMMTGFNTCNDYYDCVFSSGLTNSLKTKSLHRRNVKHFIEKYNFIKIDYKPNCF